MAETLILQLTLEMPEFAELVKTAAADGVDVSTVVSTVIAAKIAEDRTTALTQQAIVNNPNNGFAVNGNEIPFGAPPPSPLLQADPQDERPD